MDGVLVVGCCWFTMAKKQSRLAGLDLVICGNLEFQAGMNPTHLPVFLLWWWVC
jgi:hypothetical protein